MAWRCCPGTATEAHKKCTDLLKCQMAGPGAMGDGLTRVPGAGTTECRSGEGARDSAARVSGRRRGEEERKHARCREGQMERLVLAKE